MQFEELREFRRKVIAEVVSKKKYKKREKPGRGH